MLLLWLYFLNVVSSRTLTWNADNHEVQNSITISRNISSYNATVSWYHKETFRFKVSAQDEFSTFTGVSECYNLASGPLSLRTILSNINLVNDNENSIKLSEFFDVSAASLTDYTNKNSTFYKYNIIFKNTRKHSLASFNIDYAERCGALIKVFRWNDRLNWDGKTVPTSDDDVIIPVGAGTIILENSIAVKSLTMFDGTLIAHHTMCRDGWSADPVFGTKCYKLYENASTYDEAQSTCNSVGTSSLDAHLIQIQSKKELSNAMRMCRGNKESPAARGGCWIGLRDHYGIGNYDWNQPLTSGDDAEFNTLFLDWRRDEPNNRTISEGIPTNGEQCVVLIPWQTDPLIEEQGSWEDESCHLKKSFVCQIFGHTTRYHITIQNKVNLNGGSLEGGIMMIHGASSTITNYEAHRSATIIISNTATNTMIGNLFLNDGSTLLLQTTVSSATSSFIGETIPDRDIVPLNQEIQLMQPVVNLDHNVVINVDGNLTINARAEFFGTVNVKSGSVSLLQGGVLSQSTIQLDTKQSSFNLAGYGARLSSYDAFELKVSHRGPYIGEFYNNIKKEFHDIHFNTTQQGVYRIKVTRQNNNDNDISACIPYNATSTELTNILDKLPLIEQCGGVTVRRYGNSDSPRFAYGYTYRIETDAIPTSSFMSGPLNFTIHCYGDFDGCQCAETKVPLMDNTGQPQCPNVIPVGNISLVNPFACVTAPKITMDRISIQSYTITTGLGSLNVIDGIHRLPPISGVTVSSFSGIGITTADIISWNKIQVGNIGTLILAGTSWEAWDSATVLYAPEWTYRRGFVSQLSNIPAFNFFANESILEEGLGSILSAAPGSNLTWNRALWGGGIIGGRSTVYINDYINITNTGKSLRYGITLFITDQATMTWQSGNISLADGADIIVEGTFVIDSTQTPVFVGQAQLLEAPANNENAEILLKRAQGRDWHGYFGNELPSILRGGWYQDPLCGDQCLITNHLLVRQNGTVICNDNSTVTFSVPLDLIGYSRLVMGYDVSITLSSGGICGNDVVFDINSGTILELNGGQMLMQASCTIRGEGELLVSAGAHNLAFSIDAHITIAGGAMIWPLSRGTKKTLTFNGGLLIEKTGQIQVEPFSTTILVHQTVQIKDQGLITFPRIGIAAQASPFDGQDAPDTSPRGNFTSTGIMKWDGGTLMGKADFNALYSLYLNGDTKYIRSLAKLVNKGHCEWGSGNLISNDNGGFLNLGTLQMLNGVSQFEASAMYEGTELPIDSGGDVFALKYHSWDMDDGGLSYSEYVKLRTEFVSRAPNGWTVGSQVSPSPTFQPTSV